MARRPIIGITSDYNDALTQYALPYPYCAAIEVAGGLPIMLPYRVADELIDQYASAVDGMLFSGGNDLDPSTWNEPRHPKAEAIDPLREAFERKLMAAIERRRVPTLGICLGSQLMNVYRGGTLNQFIPDFAQSIEHRRLGSEWTARHDVAVEPDSTLAEAMGTTSVRSNSSHKQSIKEVGRGLRVVARAADGIVEAIEDPTLPLWLGVQWHPERQHEESEQHRLFKLLIDRAAKFAATR